MIPISQYMSKKVNGAIEDRPMFTSLYYATAQGAALNPSRLYQSDYRQFWKKFKNSPELVATLNIPITDVVGDRPEWTAPDGTPLSDLELRRATKFWRDNRGKEVVKALLFDGFLLGQGFIWKSKFSKSQLNAALKEVLAKHNLQLSDLQIKEIESENSLDEVVKKKKKIDYVAASTMDILYDEYDIYGYQQNANGIIAKFSTEDIIHYRYMALDGRVEGWSPVAALVAEIYLLTAIKQNMISFIDNGGTPDKVFILPKELAGSKNHEFLIAQLQKYKRVQNKHGNLVFTGEMTIQDLQGNPKDLEYKDLALYMTSNIAFTFGIPISRIPFLIGSSATGGDAGGLSESGYWNKISDIQDTIEDLLNGQLFNEMGWNINFNRKYKNDYVKQAQIDNMNADSIIKYQQILSANGKKLTTDKILNLLGWRADDIEENDMAINPQSNSMNQNMLPNKDLMMSDSQRKKSNTKRNVANNQEVSNNMYNP